MKRFLYTILLAIAVSTMTYAQDCKVPVSFLFRYDHNQSNESGYRGGYRGDDDGLHKWDTFLKFLSDHNLSEDTRNTRFAIALNYISGPRSLQLRVSLYDTENSVALYTVKLDTCYADDDIFKLSLKMDEDLFSGQNLQFCSVIDTLRSKIINIYETGTVPWLKIIRKHIAEGEIELAMFKLAQYPTCCPSYSRVQPFIVATFREYVRTDQARLLRQAKIAWDDNKSETDARFVVSLLNSEKLSDGNRKKADKILKKVTKKYPTLDINAHEDYVAIPEFTAVIAKLVYRLGNNYGSMHAPETFNYIPDM